MKRGRIILQVFLFFFIRDFDRGCRLEVSLFFILLGVVVFVLSYHRCTHEIYLDVYVGGSEFLGKPAASKFGEADWILH